MDKHTIKTLEDIKREKERIKNYYSISLSSKDIETLASILNLNISVSKYPFELKPNGTSYIVAKTFLLEYEKEILKNQEEIKTLLKGLKYPFEVVFRPSKKGIDRLIKENQSYIKNHVENTIDKRIEAYKYKLKDRILKDYLTHYLKHNKNLKDAKNNIDSYLEAVENPIAELIEDIKLELYVEISTLVNLTIIDKTTAKIADVINIKIKEN